MMTIKTVSETFTSAIKNRRVICAGLTAAAGLFAADASQAAVLAAYDFTGASGVATTVGTGVNAGTFTVNLGADEGSVSADIALSASGNGFIRSDATGSDVTAALADDDFFSVTIAAANPGEFLDLNSLTLAFRNERNAASPSFTNTIYLQSSVGGLGSGNPTISGTNTSITASGSGATIQTATFDLSDISFSNLTSITFEFRFSDNTTLAGYLSRIDDVTLNGDVVPEPGSLALIGLGGLLIGTRRRRNA